MGVIVVAGVAAPPPFVATLLAPSNGSYLDLSGTPTFSWQYNPGQVGLSQTSWQFYILENGSGTPQYWNVTASAFQATAVFNAGSAQSYTFPTGVFSDGNVYQWTVVTRDNNGTSPAAAFFTVNAQQVPSVTVTTPSGTIITSDPIVNWTVSYPSGATQTSYRVVIYTNAQYSISGFTPGTSPSTYDSGVQGSAYQVSLDLSKVPFYLPNGIQYRSYVQISETGGQYSAWAYSSFQVNYTPPKTPTVTALDGTDSVTGCPLVALTVQGHDNLLSQVDAIPTTGSARGTWVAGADTTLTSGTFAGTFALSLTATAAGNISASTAPGAAGYPVTAGQEYTGIANLRAATTGRSAYAQLTWYNSLGTLLSTVDGTVVTDGPLSWIQASVTAVAPTNAAYASLGVVVNSAALSEVHAFQLAALLLGPDVTWGPGGFVGLQELLILRSDGLYVRTASQSNPSSIPAATQFVVIDDYEAVQTVEYTYAAQVMVTYGPNQTVLSNAGVSGAVTLTTTPLSWWFLNPLSPSSAVLVNPTLWNPQNTEALTPHMVTGATVLNMVANTVLRQDFTGTFVTFDAATYKAFEALLTGQATVFLSSPWGESDSGYFRIGPMSGGMSTGVGTKAKDVTLNASTASNPYRTVAINAVAQYRVQDDPPA